MAFSNTFDTTNTGSAVSNREDLTDVLTILAPEETPILSSANKERASATNVEWTVDSLSAPQTGGISEGADVSAFTDKFASRAKAIRELKRDVEATLAGTQDKATEDGAGTANALRGLGDFLDSAGPADVPAAYRTPADSIYTTTEANAAEFSESKLNDIISSIFRVTGSANNLMLVADTGLRRVISDFARTSAGAAEQIRSVNYDGNSGSIKLSVDLYESDHGVVSIVNQNPDCAPNFGGNTTTGSGYIVNPEYYGVHELIPMGSTRLPNLGGGERGFVDCALTLGVYHPGAHGVIQDIT
jgi:hypothetical protein